MSSTEYENEKSTSVNDFGMWCLKMQALLVQQGLLEALNGSEKMDVSLTEKAGMTMIEKSHSAIILSLDDKILRQVSKEKTIADPWIKLEGLYMTSFWSITYT